MEKKLEICQCGHDEKSHNVRNALPLHGCGTKGCFCQHFVPAYSQPSRIRSGFELDNGTSGTAANTFYPPTEVRDEKIAQIIKEFDKKFHKMTVEWDETEKIYRWPQKQVEAWLTQTLTILLNEE